MPRPRKCRKVCHIPENTGFNPIKPNKGRKPIILNVDEYETLRLIDREGFSQEQCGEYMGVGRTTVQQIYLAAFLDSVKSVASVLRTPHHASELISRICLRYLP